jgi:two-component system response regulator (stage 0 sporulation protein A)
VNEKITVLVADDNSDFTMTLSNYLEKEEQIQIVGIARDGNEAYDMAVNLKPDILLLDIIMPHLDGLGVLEKLGETNLEKRPLSIILSAVGQDKITQKAIALGAQYYIVKPFDINVLIKRMKELKNYQPVNNSTQKSVGAATLTDFFVHQKTADILRCFYIIIFSFRL